jgi:hypothetical protein
MARGGRLEALTLGAREEEEEEEIERREEAGDA